MVTLLIPALVAKYTKPGTGVLENSRMIVLREQSRLISQDELAELQLAENPAKNRRLIAKDNMRL